MAENKKTKENKQQRRRQGLDQQPERYSVSPVHNIQGECSVLETARDPDTGPAKTGLASSEGGRGTGGAAALIVSPMLFSLPGSRRPGHAPSPDGASRSCPDQCDSSSQRLFSRELCSLRSQL